MTRTKMSAFFWLPYQSNSSLIAQSFYAHSLLKLLVKATVLVHGNLLHANVQIGVFVLKVLIFISPKIQCKVLTPSESTLLLRLRIDSLPGFWMSVIHSRIQMFRFMKQYVSVHHPIILTGLKNIMFLSIYMMVHFVFNA